MAAIKSFITKAEEADIIVPIGGASVGDHDYMRAAFAELGYETLFEKIAVRPGKPTWFASKGDHAPAFCALISALTRPAASSPHPQQIRIAPCSPRS